MFYHQGSTWGSYNKQVRLPFLIWAGNGHFPYFLRGQKPLWKLGMFHCKGRSMERTICEYMMISLSLYPGILYIMCVDGYVDPKWPAATWKERVDSQLPVADISHWIPRAIMWIRYTLECHSIPAILLSFAIQYLHNLLGCTLLITLLNMAIYSEFSH